MHANQSYMATLPRTKGMGLDVHWQVQASPMHHIQQARSASKAIMSLPVLVNNEMTQQCIPEHMTP